MPKRTQIVHEKDRFLVAEEAGDLRRPNLVIYAHHSNASLQAEEGTFAFETEGNNKWSPIAEVIEGAMVLRISEDGGSVEFLKKLLQRYLWERAEAQSRVENPWWYVVVNGRPLHFLDRAVPTGLLLPLYSEKDDAENTLRESNLEGDVCSTGARREFLRFRAEEGFAGAVLDGKEYIYWCIDDESEMQFLKLRPDRENNDISGHLLGEKGEWGVWDGEEELDFVEDQSRWDTLMVRILGEIPFVSYAQDMIHYSLYEAGAVVLIEDEEEERVAPVFAEPVHARRFAAEHELTGTEVESVLDLRELVSEASELGAVTRIEPGEHRALGGLLWLRHGRLVLDSFSGFWDSEDGSEFLSVNL